MDAETRAYLDEFRRSLEASMRALNEETRQWMRELNDETRQSLEASMRALNDDTRQSMRELNDETRQSLETSMRVQNEETRRHFDVVAEGLRGDIRTVAEGVVANSERIERVAVEIRHDMASEARLLHAAIRSVSRTVARRRGR